MVNNLYAFVPINSYPLTFELNKKLETYEILKKEEGHHRITVFAGGFYLLNFSRAFAQPFFGLANACDSFFKYSMDSPSKRTHFICLGLKAAASITSCVHYRAGLAFSLSSDLVDYAEDFFVNLKCKNYKQTKKSACLIGKSFIHLAAVAIPSPQLIAISLVAQIAWLGYQNYPNVQKFLDPKQRSQEVTAKVIVSLAAHCLFGFQLKQQLNAF